MMMVDSMEVKLVVDVEVAEAVDN